MVSPLQTGDFDRKCVPIRKGQRITCVTRDSEGKTRREKKVFAKTSQVSAQSELIRFSGKNGNKQNRNQIRKC